MARTKSKTQQTKLAATRLLQDEDVQKQIRSGVLRLREAWSRASRRPASKAVGDKKIYSKVRDAATSFAAAGRTLRRKPDPPKRRGRKVIAGAAVAGGAAYAVKRRRSGSGAPEYEGQTMQSAPSPFPVSPVPVA